MLDFRDISTGKTKREKEFEKVKTDNSEAKKSRKEISELIAQLTLNGVITPKQYEKITGKPYVE